MVVFEYIVFCHKIKGGFVVVIYKENREEENRKIIITRCSALVLELFF